jgi:hypothetical protein
MNLCTNAAPGNAGPGRHPDDPPEGRIDRGDAAGPAFGNVLANSLTWTAASTILDEKDATVIFTALASQTDGLAPQHTVFPHSKPFIILILNRFLTLEPDLFYS